MTFFRDTNSVKRIVVCWVGILNENPIKNLPTNKLDWGRKPKNKWEHPSPVKELMSLKWSSCWWKTSPMTDNWRGKPMTVEERKVVDKKPLYQRGVLGEKLTPYNQSLNRMRELKSRSSWPKQSTGKHMQSYATWLKMLSIEVIQICSKTR